MCPLTISLALFPLCVFSQRAGFISPIWCAIFCEQPSRVTRVLSLLQVKEVSGFLNDEQRIEGLQTVVKFVLHFDDYSASVRAHKSRECSAHKTQHIAFFQPVVA